MRELKFSQAILEATDQCMARDPNVYVMGLGVPDPKGIFGTTIGLSQKYGEKRVFDMPTSENGMTGVAIGSAIMGKRPILVHQRVDFALLSLDQIINNAAKWHYMFDGKASVPLVIRLVVGRGWGQGPQHSQNLHSIFAHIPGLKVVIPSTPYDAKGLLVSAIEDNNPVMFIEHRWLHHVFGDVPSEIYREPLGVGRVVCEGSDVTLVSSSYMMLEALRAAHLLKTMKIHAEVIDLRTIKPFDEKMILQSVEKTGRCVVVDSDWRTCSFAAEMIACVAEKSWAKLLAPPQRLTLPDVPIPSTPALSHACYPRAIHIINAVLTLFEQDQTTEDALNIRPEMPLDVPDTNFTGPF